MLYMYYVSIQTEVTTCFIFSKNSALWSWSRSGAGLMCRSRTDDQTPPAKSYAQIQLCIYRRDDKNHKILCESVSAMTWQKLL